MTLFVDIPECPPSPIQRLDPRWKLAALLPASLACALLREWGPACAALGGALLLVALARLPWGWYYRRMGAAMLLFIVFLIWLPFVAEPDDRALQVGWLTLSLDGLARLGVLTAKLSALISVMLVLLATAPLHDTFKAARALWIPGLLVQLALLTHRYVFLLIEEFGRLRTALRVRGFRNRAGLHSYRTIGQVAGILLVRSHERSERVAQAMRCRGFDGEYRSLHAFHSGWRDVLAFAAIAGYAVGLLAWDWLAH